ncbi:MAG: hypothetical protein QXK06_01270 [Candidatus Diapherotrites archaeon]
MANSGICPSPYLSPEEIKKIMEQVPGARARFLALGRIFGFKEKIPRLYWDALGWRTLIKTHNSAQILNIAKGLKTSEARARLTQKAIELHKQEIQKRATQNPLPRHSKPKRQTIKRMPPKRKPK